MDPELDGKEPEEDIEITLEDETEGKEPEIVVEEAHKPEEIAEKPVETLDDGLEKLKANLANEQKARAEAERRANELAQSAHEAKSEAQDANLNLITSAIRTVEQNNEILKANYKAALANQDYDSAADLQIEMANNAAKLQQLENGKQALETAPKAEAPRPYTPDPVEALASQLTPRSAAWVRSHPEYATDTNKYAQMLAAHNLAVASGIAPDTDAYFEAVEDSLRIRKAPEPKTDGEVVHRSAAPAAAPVSRSSGAIAPGQKTNRVTLSAEEREMADMMGITVEDYARNKLALIKEGKLN